MKRSVRIIVTAILLVAGTLSGYVAGAGDLDVLTSSLAAQGECQTFPETGKQVCGRFLAYWRANGGLAQQGLPLSEEFDERSDVNGQTYKVQYFERAVFEYHPENQPPYDVLLSLLGREKYLAKYPPASATPPRVGDRARSGTTAVTLHALIDPATSTSSSTPKAGNRFVVVDVSVENVGAAESSYNAFDFALKTTDNRPYEAAFISSQYNPRLASGKLQPGEIVRGYIAFEIPIGAALATFTFDGGTTRGRIVFDVAR